MQVDFWDLLEIEPTWLRLFKWAQVVKTNHVNSPWNPQMPNFISKLFLKTLNKSSHNSDQTDGDFDMKEIHKLNTQLSTNQE